jgi:hypothetical protein
MKPFRKAIFDVLNGNVSYASSVVPLYDKKVRTGETPQIYMYFGSQSELYATDQDCAWQTKSTLNLVFVAKSGSEVSQDVLDDISDSALTLLINLPGHDNLGAQNGFQILEVRMESAAAGEVQISPTETELQKVVSLTAYIFHQ